MNTLVAIKTGNLELVKEKIDKYDIQTNYHTLGLTALHLAIRYNKIAIAELLINSGSDVNITTNTNDNILYGVPDAEPMIHLALKYSDDNMLNLLIRSSVDLSLKDSLHRTALMLSVELEKVESTRILLESGAAKFQTPNEMTECLVSLINQKDYKLISSFLKTGMDIDNRFKANTFSNKPLLQIALENMDIELLKLFFDFNLNITLCIDEIVSWLYSYYPGNVKELEINQNYFEIVSLLLTRGFDLNNMDLFQKACNSDNLDFINFLFQSIADLKPSTIGQVLNIGNAESINLMIDYLISKNILEATIFQIINHEDTSVIDSLISSKKVLLNAVKHCNVELIDIIVDKLEECNKVNSIFDEIAKDRHILNTSVLHHGSLLTHCIENGLYRVIELMLKDGAQFTASEKPLFRAIEKNDIKLLNLLINYDADLVNKSIHEWSDKKFLCLQTTPLSYAIELGNSKIAQLLIESSNIININTPLFYAIKRGDIELCYLLIIHDSDVNQCIELRSTRQSNKNNTVLEKLDYITPLSYALELDKTEIVKLLINFGADINFTKSWTWFPHQSAYVKKGTLVSPIDQIISKNNIELLSFINNNCLEAVSDPLPMKRKIDEIMSEIVVCDNDAQAFSSEEVVLGGENKLNDAI